MPVRLTSPPTFTMWDPRVHDTPSWISNVFCFVLRGPVIAPPIGV